MSADSLVGRVAGEGVALPYVALGSQMVLLKEVLQYNALKGVCAGANAAASKAKLPFSAEVQRLQRARDKTPSAVMKDKYASAIRRAKVEQRQAAERARRERFTRTVHFRALLYTFAPLEPRRRNCVKMMHEMGRSTVQPRDWCATLSQCKPSPM